MKTLPLLFFTYLVLLFYSCEVPKEKVIKKEVVVKSVDTITKKEEKLRQNDYVSENLKKIYETYGCLNKDNFILNGFDENGKEKYVLFVNGNCFILDWVCDSKRCWLEEDYYNEFSCVDLYKKESCYYEELECGKGKIRKGCKCYQIESKREKEIYCKSDEECKKIFGNPESYCDSGLCRSGRNFKIGD